MGQIEPLEPRLVGRFPGYRERILRKYFQDVAVAELCRDYDCLIETLEAAKSRQGTASHDSELRRELLELTKALEKELLVRIGPGFGQGHSEANSA